MTVQVPLPYGRGQLIVGVPSTSRILSIADIPPLPHIAETIRTAIRKPSFGPSLESLIRPGHRVAISVCDVTRPFPARVVLPPLLDELASLHCEATIFIATGTHRACSTSELTAMFGDAILARCSVAQHDAFDASSHEQVGRLSVTGTPVLIDKAFLEHDVRITTGFIEPHFFAGFSGGPKMLAPGLAAIETIMDLHSATRIGSPLATWGITGLNPVQDAIREIAAMVRIDFNLDVTLNGAKEVTGVFSGTLFESHALGCNFAKQAAMVAVPELFDVVVTTNSGYPLDQNLYQTVKGISAAAQIIRNGGTIVSASECADGMPNHSNYGRLLREVTSPIEFLRLLSNPRFAQHDQWQVQVQAQIQRRARVLVKTDGVSADDLRAAWLEPIDDISGFLAEAASSGLKIGILPDGPQAIPYLASE